MDIDKIAKNIKTLRKAHKETQEELAAAINVSPQAVGNYEAAIRLPDIQKLTEIAGRVVTLG